eukprot:UN06648
MIIMRWLPCYLTFPIPIDIQLSLWVSVSRIFFVGPRLLLIWFYHPNINREYPHFFFIFIRFNIYSFPKIRFFVLGSISKKSWTFLVFNRTM